MNEASRKSQISLVLRFFPFIFIISYFSALLMITVKSRWEMRRLSFRDIFARYFFWWWIYEKSNTEEEEKEKHLGKIKYLNKFYNSTFQRWSLFDLNKLCLSFIHFGASNEKWIKQDSQHTLGEDEERVYARLWDSWDSLRLRENRLLLDFRRVCEPSTPR